MSNDLFAQALTHHNAGRHEMATEFYRQILARQPTHLEANHLLGILLFQQGRLEAAQLLLGRASVSADATPEMHNNYGVVLHALSRLEQAVAAFERALEMRPDYAEALNNLGAVHKEAGRATEAIAIFQRVLCLQPDYAAARANLQDAYSTIIPPWHFAMMNDTVRNVAYEGAIRRAVAGRRVLDIGTGAGLLAMMAARAGAASVTTCEKIVPVADCARKIVTLNRLEGRITVIGKMSTQLVVGEDIPERAEVLVTETFSSGLMGEGVLSAVEHARGALLTPDAIVIPRVASARGYLVGGKELCEKLFVDRVADFNLAPFADFAPAKIGLCLDREPYQILSDDFDLLRFALRESAFPAARHDIAVRATAAGLCAGVAQWMALELDSECLYENRPSPEATSTTWAHVVYRFPKAVPVKPGDTVRIVVGHDRKAISVDFRG